VSRRASDYSVSPEFGAIFHYLLTYLLTYLRWIHNKSNCKLSTLKPELRGFMILPTFLSLFYFLMLSSFYIRSFLLCSIVLPCAVRNKLIDWSIDFAANISDVLAGYLSWRSTWESPCSRWGSVRCSAVHLECPGSAPSSPWASVGDESQELCWNDRCSCECSREEARRRRRGTETCLPVEIYLQSA